MGIADSGSVRPIYISTYDPLTTGATIQLDPLSFSKIDEIS